MDDIAGINRGWAPRLAQESRRGNLTISSRVRPAGAMPSRPKSSARLCLAPSTGDRMPSRPSSTSCDEQPANFSALNEFGTLLTNMGAIDAACRVYSEAIAHHP